MLHWLKRLIKFSKCFWKLEKRIYKEIENNDVELKLNSGVTEIISENNVAKSVKLDNGETVNFDIALFSIGITPNIDFLPKELKTDSGKITVNDNLKQILKMCMPLEIVFLTNITKLAEIYTLHLEM